MAEGSSYDSVGTTYSLPFCKSTELMYYNEDALLGLDLSIQDSTINNSQPLTAEYLNQLTWEEFFEKLCPAIVAKNNALSEEEKIYNDDDPSSCLLAIDSDENYFITLAHQYGYGYTSVGEDGKGSVDFYAPTEPESMMTMVKYLKAFMENIARI